MEHASNFADLAEPTDLTIRGHFADRSAGAWELVAARVNTMNMRPVRHSWSRRDPLPTR